MTMMWVGIGSTVGSLAGSVYSANKNADAMEDANSGDLPDWLKPYIKGDGEIPSYLTEDPLINTNWLDHIGQLGQGQYDSEWQPAFSNSPHFNPEQTFTPEQDGSPYGAGPPPPPPEEAPPEQQGLPPMFAGMFGPQQQQTSGMTDDPFMNSTMDSMLNRPPSGLSGTFQGQQLSNEQLMQLIGRG